MNLCRCIAPANLDSRCLLDEMALTSGKRRRYDATAYKMNRSRRLGQVSAYNASHAEENRETNHAGTWPVKRQIMCKTTGRLNVTRMRLKRLVSRNRPPIKISGAKKAGAI